jgi:hypothetical protein
MLKENLILCKGKKFNFRNHFLGEKRERERERGRGRERKRERKSERVFFWFLAGKENEVRSWAIKWDPG